MIIRTLVSRGNNYQLYTSSLFGSLPLCLLFMMFWALGMEVLIRVLSFDSSASFVNAHDEYPVQPFLDMVHARVLMNLLVCEYEFECFSNMGIC